MATRHDDWQYALRIRGATPKAMPLGRMGDYLRAFATLLGEAHRPTFGGVVKGSALLRAAVPPESTNRVHARLVAARTSDDSSAANAVESIATLLDRDGCDARVETRSGAVLIQFPKKTRPVLQREYVVQDSAAIDGIVVAVEGIDSTAHVRIRDAVGEVHSLTLRDLGLARDLAKHFRSNAIRAHVHGSWRRTAEGKWESSTLYLDRYEELDDVSAKSLFDQLIALDGNRWASMDDPEAFWRSVRGIE